MIGLAKYCVEHAFQVALLAFSAYLLLHAARTHLVTILKFFLALVKLIINEVKLGGRKSAAERINLLGVVACCGVLFFVAIPASVRHALFGDAGESDSLILVYLLIIFAAVLFGSAVWLYVMAREERIRKKVSR